MKVTDKYVFFFTSNDIFSNWWSRSAFTYRGFMFHTNEQYIMYRKAMLFGDHRVANLILNVLGGNPKESKALGRGVSGFNEGMWLEKRESIMKQGLWLKAKYCNRFRQELLMHYREGRKFVEASPYDKIWGVGFSEDTAEANVEKWGLNLLGKCLDEVAEYIDKEGDDECLILS